MRYIKLPIDSIVRNGLASEATILTPVAPGSCMVVSAKRRTPFEASDGDVFGQALRLTEKGIEGHIYAPAHIENGYAILNGVEIGRLYCDPPPPGIELRRGVEFDKNEDPSPLEAFQSFEEAARDCALNLPILGRGLPLKAYIELSLEPEEAARLSLNDLERIYEATREPSMRSILDRHISSALLEMGQEMSAKAAPGAM